MGLRGRAEKEKVALCAFSYIQSIVSRCHPSPGAVSIIANTGRAGSVGQPDHFLLVSPTELWPLLQDRLER